MSAVALVIWRHFDSQYLSHFPAEVMSIFNTIFLRTGYKTPFISIDTDFYDSHLIELGVKDAVSDELSLLTDVSIRHGCCMKCHLLSREVMERVHS